MKSNRRKFIKKSIAGGLAASALPLSSCDMGSKSSDSGFKVNPNYAKLDEILSKPVLKKELFNNPVIIESLELMRFEDSYICRVRSTDGAEGISIAHYEIKRLYPIFLRSKPFLIGQDARELDKIVERIYIYLLNYRFNGIAMGTPLAIMEFAILEMLGKIANKSVGELIGEIHHPEVGVYIATGKCEVPLEEHFDHIKESFAEYDVNALKMKVGYQHIGTRDIHYPGVPGKSEKLIPLVRKHFGDDITLYADANGYYDVEGAIKIGRILEEYNFSYFEEPVMFDHFEDIKQVADQLSIPIANGEQDYSFVNFRWLIANDGIEVVMPDNYYFGGYIRSMKVAQMADAFGKKIMPHMSSGGLGFLYNIHLVSVCPNAGPHHEFKGLETHVPFECKTSPLKVVDGKIKVPTGPGFGVEIDPDFIAKHEVLER